MLQSQPLHLFYAMQVGLGVRVKCMLSIALTPVSNKSRQLSKLKYVHVNNGNQNTSKHFNAYCMASLSNMPMLWFAAVQGNHIRRLTDRAVWTSQGPVTTLDSNNLASWVLCMTMYDNVNIMISFICSRTTLRCTIAGLAVGISLLALYETYRERWENVQVWPLGIFRSYECLNPVLSLWLVVLHIFAPHVSWRMYWCRDEHLPDDDLENWCTTATPPDINQRFTISLRIRAD